MDHRAKARKWEKCKFALSKAFFRDVDIIKRNSTEYHNFWLFLNKYAAYQNTANARTYYDKELRISFSVKYTDTDELLVRLPPADADAEQKLTRRDIEEFRSVLLHYLDFLQKQKFNKLVNLRKNLASLPIYSFKSNIVSTVRNERVTIIAGDTGCGKSTQVPQYLAANGFDKIACTQPRRIACTSLCKRVAYETLNEYGSEIGYQIRFEKRKTQHTRIVFLTEGLLLRQVASDPSLSCYNVIVLDEVHERHLHSDFLLGIMKCLITQRQDLKVILMSATINLVLFAKYFDNVPVVQVPGRLFPIQLQYFPVSGEESTSKTSRINPSPYIRIMNLIDKKCAETERGDLLIFLSGITEISAVVGAAEMYAQQTKRWIVLPLHSTLSIAEQDKVFDLPPDFVRKCIISTNIAETSITIDGVRFVVDSGKMKEMSYDSSSRMQRLQEFWISKASAEQRKGRAGRTGPGVCYRLYSEENYEAMEDYSIPEIQRVPFDSLVLQMISMDLANVRIFPFIEPPLPEKIEHALTNLKEQDAITEKEELTALGRMLSNLPVDILIGKMLIMGTLFSVIEPVLTLAASLGVQSPITNRGQRDPDAVAARRPLESQHGDTFTLLNLYNEWLQVKSEKKSNSRKWCKHRGLEEQRFYDMTKLRQQFKQLLQDANQMLSSKNNLKSNERAQRHGEVKKLRELKRKFHHESRRKKILKMQQDDISDDDDEDDSVNTNIKDIEFQLSFSHTEIQKLSEANRAMKLEHVTLLKIILSSGLYSQFALPDEHNSYKPEADHIFHTKKKAFVVLHPMSVFASNPDHLQLTDADKLNFPQFQTKSTVSNRHQMLVYMSLLETVKPYLMNTTRVPSAQTLLLFSSQIDTNQDFSRLVFDEWLEVRFPDSFNGQELIMETISIRDFWGNVLKEKIEGSAISNREQDSHEKSLSRQLVSFYQSDVSYTIKRLVAADATDLYVGSECKAEPFDSKVFGRILNIDKHKGGMRVNEYLTYGCLQEENVMSTSYLKTHWTCPLCDCSMVTCALERVEHQLECKNKLENKTHVDPNKSDSNNTGYFCTVCNCQLFLSTIELLRHKKSHPRC